MRKLRLLEANRKVSTAERFALRAWAQELAEQYDWDENWIEEILLKTVDHAGFGKDQRRTRSGNAVLRRFIPSLHSALAAMPFEDVKRLFGKDAESLAQLKWNERRWRDLIASPLPLETFEHILSVADEFRNYLDRSTEEVVLYGEPLTPFLASAWLQRTFTDCKEFLSLNGEVMEEFIDQSDDESPIFIPPPKLKSFAEIAQEEAVPLEPSEYDTKKKYILTTADLVTRGFHSKITLMVFKKLTAGQEELSSKLREAFRAEAFVEREKDLRRKLHQFSIRCFTHFVNAIASRTKTDSYITLNQLLAECWNSLAAELDPLQIEVLAGNGLSYFGLLDYPQENARWYYNTSIPRRIFSTAIVLEKIIREKWDEKIQNPLAGISELCPRDDNENYLRHPMCNYFQAVSICDDKGKDKVDSALRSFALLRDDFWEARKKSKQSLSTAHELVSDKKLKSQDAHLDKLAIERIKAMGGFVVFPEKETKVTEKVNSTTHEPGMIGDCEGYLMKNGKTIPLRGPQQRAVIRLLYSKKDATPKYAATLYEILSELYCGEANEKMNAFKKGTWRLDNTLFKNGQHLAWKLGLIKLVPKIDPADDTRYYLDLNFEAGPERKKRNTVTKENAAAPATTKNKKAHGPAMTVSPGGNHKKKATRPA